MSEPSILVLGNFDGVHRGHRALLSEAKSLKKRLSLPITVWSFERLPGKCLTPTPLRHKLLMESGADTVVFDDFDRVRDFSPRRFFEEIVLGALNARAVVCGFNYSFGCGGKGNAETMAFFCREAGIDCLVVPEVRIDGETVSSTRIRSLLREGNVEAAANLMCQPFFLSSPVQEGRHYGRTQGVPTVNQAVPRDVCLPKPGVYATFCIVKGEIFPSVTNIGFCPTVTDGSRLTVETHILDFDGDFTEKTLTVGFLAFLREEIAFSSPDELYAEVGRNMEQAKRIFSEDFSIP